MPKTKQERLKSYISEFGGDKIFDIKNGIVFCQICEKVIYCNQKSHIEQHVNTIRHKELADKKEASTSSGLRQSFITSVLKDGAPTKQEQFNADLCKAFVSADIPFWKLQNEVFRSFLEKYMVQNRIPDESTIRKNYLPQCFEQFMHNVTSSLRNKKIWISIDETTDSAGRFVANVIAGVLFEDKPTEPYLLNVEFLEKTNNTTIAQLFDDSIKLIDPKFNRDNVLLLVSDAALYMIKAGKTIKVKNKE